MKGRMTALALLALVLVVLPGVWAQNAGTSADSALESNFMFDVLQDVLQAVRASGFLPNLNPNEDSDQFRAFIMFALLVWMVIEVYFEAGKVMNVIFTLAITLGFFKLTQTFFTTTVVEQVFSLVFSALFIFLVTDFLLGFAWGISARTRLLFNVSVTAIAVAVLNFTSIYVRVSNFIIGLSWGGVAGFLILMVVMRLFNSFFSMMRMSTAVELRKAGASTVSKQQDAIRKKS
ncbi:MAG TPA: hypothetical protein ENN60_01625 [archaeon]|nr:hypothetical protein [archaeon]